MTSSMQPRRTWLLSRKEQDDESQWDAFLSNKRDALNRMKAGRQEALRRLGSDRTQERSTISVMSDERDAPESHKENAAVREVPVSMESRDDPAVSGGEELDMHRLAEMFTVIEKRRWDDLIQLLQIHPRAAALPCPKNLRTSAKGNLMLHEACRNSPPVQVITALMIDYGDAVKSKGGKGYLPLHYACATGASVDVVKQLVESFPASIRTRDTNDLMIPLHFACKWGASADVVSILVRMHPEGKQVRDIYAKTPADYASELGEERDAVLASLNGRSTVVSGNHSVVSTANRSVSSNRSISHSGSEVSSINLNDEASSAHSDKKLRRELTSTKSKLKKLTKELNERERKFSLLYGAEKEKAFELQKQKELLEHECLQAKMVQEEQSKKIRLLEQEYRTLKSLQDTHGQKKNMLEDKIKQLEKERIELGSGKGMKIKEELTAAMKEQEIKYKAMLKSEQEKIQELEGRAREAELTHRHYTMALLQEHEKEVSKFEELTSRFKVLESQLRREIENERTKRLEAQDKAKNSGSGLQTSFG